MESRDVLKIHGALRRYCTSRVSLRSTLEVQYLLNLPCIFNTSLDSMVYLPIIFILTYIRLLHILLYIFTGEMYFPIHPLVDVFITFTRGCIFLKKIFFHYVSWPPLGQLHSNFFFKKIHPLVGVLNTSISECIAKYNSP